MGIMSPARRYFGFHILKFNISREELFSSENSVSIDGLLKMPLQRRPLFMVANWP
jgi:hypothetical protein